MRIAIASGKGGTGKTTVATNLARVAALAGQEAAYVDCDVEEPNGHLFLKPSLHRSEEVSSLVPVVDQEKCTLCGLCGEICQYSAIVPLGNKILVYPELCHACGGCSLVCKAGAISQAPRTIGTIQQGNAGPIEFVHGLLHIGEAMSPPLIRLVKKALSDADTLFIDAPPGTSCPVIESIRDVDYLLLVTEPTPFGLNDLKLAVDMARALSLPFSVIINRADSGDRSVHAFCLDNRIRILSEIPDDRRIAEAYSRGLLATDVLPDYRSVFESILSQVEKSVQQIRRFGVRVRRVQT